MKSDAFFQAFINAVALILWHAPTWAWVGMFFLTMDIYRSRGWR
jgi:hypothetical protein